MGTVFSTGNPAFMNWSFVFVAQHEDPEVGSVSQQLTIRPFASESGVEKIRNVEMGKLSVKQRQPATLPEEVKKKLMFYPLED